MKNKFENTEIVITRAGFNTISREVCLNAVTMESADEVEST